MPSLRMLKKEDRVKKSVSKLVTSTRSVSESICTIDTVIKKIKNSKNIVVVAGAGISVSCGIPDFRSKNGIYELVRSLHLDLVYPEDLFDLESFKNDPVPFYKFAKTLYLEGHRPSSTHWFLKALEDKGKLQRVYTQNIDGLEHSVGLKRVIACHGDINEATCLGCHSKFKADDIKVQVMKQEVPKCNKCADTIKPNITFFGEKLPIIINRSVEADSQCADLIIVLGTSLKVAPVSKIIQKMPKSAFRVLINREMLQPLKSATKIFDVNLLGDCDVIVSHINKALKWPSLPGSSDQKSSTAIRPPVRVPPNSYLFGGIPLSVVVKIDPGEESEELVTCDDCEKNLIGRCIIYTCSVCLDFDLCLGCYNRGTSPHLRRKSHVFRRMERIKMSKS